MKEQQVAVPKRRPLKYSRLRKPCSEQERVKVGMLTSGIAQLNVLPEDLGSTARAWPHWQILFRADGLDPHPCAAQKWFQYFLDHLSFS